MSSPGGQFPTLHLGAPPDHRAQIEDPKRLAALKATGLLDSDAEAAFDRFTKLAARWLGTPVAAISLVDDLPKGDSSQLNLFELRVQNEIEARNAAPERSFQLSASIGAAMFDPTQPESIDQLLAKADALMYEQKKARKAMRRAG